MGATVVVREVNLESGGRRPYGAARIVAEASRIVGGRVAEMSERVKCDLDKDRRFFWMRLPLSRPRFA